MTVFFDKMKSNLLKNKDGIIKYVEKIILLIILAILLMYTFENSSIYKNIFYLSNSLQNIDIMPSAVEIVRNIYPVFNEKNYIVAEVNNDEIAQIKEEPEEVIIDNVNYGLIDNIDKAEARNYLNSLTNVGYVISQGPGYEAVNISSTILIKDFSDLPNIPYTDIMNKNITLTKSNDKIFVYDTHASETYSCSEMFNFSYTGTYRTTDENYNMISVASRFTKFIKERNITIIQDKTGHDYGSYTMSYGSSGASILANKEKYGEFGISIDLHRDAIEDLSFAPKCVIGGVEVAQCMLIIGVGYDGTRNEYYDENLNLALKMMLLAEKVYPGLFRPMIIRNSIYNQDLNNMSILIEIGSTGNTLDEAYRASRCLANLLDIIYID